MMTIEKLVELAHRRRMPALGLADRGNLFGALEFSETAAAKGIQPIVGCALPVIRDDDHDDDDRHGGDDHDGGGDRDGGGGGRRPAHRRRASAEIALFCADETGYRNLCRLAGRLHIDPICARRGALTLADLEKCAAGLIALSGGRNGLDPSDIASFTRLQGAFDNRFYVELQRFPGAPDRFLSVSREHELIALADRLALPLVASNDPVFAAADDHPAHETLLCIDAGVTVEDPDRPQSLADRWFKPADAMAALFADLPEALANSVEIARRCAFRPQAGAAILPRFNPEADPESENAELRKQAENGLEERLQKLRRQNALVAEETAYRNRLRNELDIIVGMKFAGYFLIVADFIAWSRKNDVPVGPGRGSGAASIVAWSLNITDLDPLRFHLVFERFLNPERVSMPDFDIDFCQDQRPRVIAYLRQRYGEERVAQIITFGSLQSRAALRDVGRALGFPYPRIDALCRAVPMNGAIPLSLDEALRQSGSRLAEIARVDREMQKVIAIARQLEGLHRHASTHAAGIVIGNEPLDRSVPLYRDPRDRGDGMLTTQFSMKWVEKAGLTKFDLLGLKTLSIIRQSLDLARENRLAPKDDPNASIPDDPADIPLDDPAAYRLIGSGMTHGLFQIEGSGVRAVIRDLQPDRFEDIIALVALYRPGPMDNIPQYIERKFNREKRDFLHPSLEKILAETYGVIVYQEQVLQIAQTLSGYSLGEADLLRRAMGKKIPEEMERQKQRFIQGAVENQVERNRAAHIFDLVSRFAGYGFNKAHAACYALLAYQTAWLKTHFPLAFFAASMHGDAASADRLQQWRQDALRMKIPILPPCFRHAQESFAVDGDGVRCALGALKHVGGEAARCVAAFKDASPPLEKIGDLARVLDPSRIGRPALQSMAQAGVFDSLNPNRAQLVDAVEPLLRAAQRRRRPDQPDQFALFDALPQDFDIEACNDRKKWSRNETLTREREAIGFYLSGHPLEPDADILAALGVTPHGEWRASQKENASPRLAGAVEKYAERRTRNGGRLAVLDLSDAGERYEVIAFTEKIDALKDLRIGDLIILDAEKIDDRGQRLELKNWRYLEDAMAELISHLDIALISEDPLPRIRSLLEKRRTQRQNQKQRPCADVCIHLKLNAGQRIVPLRLPGRYILNGDVVARLKHLDGVEKVQASIPQNQPDPQ